MTIFICHNLDSQAVAPGLVKFSIKLIGLISEIVVLPPTPSKKPPRLLGAALVFHHHPEQRPGIHLSLNHHFGELHFCAILNGQGVKSRWQFVVVEHLNQITCAEICRLAFHQSAKGIV